MVALRSLALSWLMLSAAQFAHAHGEGDHLMGTLKSADARAIAISGVDGKTANVSVDDKTSVEKDGKLVSIKDLKVGERVIVHTRKTDAGLVAVKIRAGGGRANHAGGDHGDPPSTK